MLDLFCSADVALRLSKLKLVTCFVPSSVCPLRYPAVISLVVEVFRNSQCNKRKSDITLSNIPFFSHHILIFFTSHCTLNPEVDIGTIKQQSTNYGCQKEIVPKIIFCCRLPYFNFSLFLSVTTWPRAVSYIDLPTRTAFSALGNYMC